MTRGERQASTRAQILAAARVRFLREGYVATSLEQIADDAGYSKGAVYSNFRDKPSLCREVLLTIHASRLKEVEAITADASVEGLLSDVEGWLERTVGDVGWTMLEMEFAVVSRGNAELTQMISSLHETMHGAIVATLRTARSRLGIDVAVGSAEMLSDLADLIVATTFGLAVQRAVDPTVSIQPAIYAIRSAFLTPLSEQGVKSDT
jgi:AcrR family transcriptional regulator